LNWLNNVYITWAGLDEIEHTIELHVPDYTSPNNYGAYEVMPPEQNSDCRILYTEQIDRVKMVTIDSLGIDPLFIKLDVEGMEWRTLQGARSTLDRCQPIVWCERHKSDPDKVLPFFDNRGYALTSLIEGHWTFIPPWLQINNMKNVTDVLLSR
jgi:FkbM family methyltransferase